MEEMDMIPLFRVRYRLSARACWLVLLTMSPMLVGCSRYDIDTVSGVIRLDGKPLPSATITFTPLDGRASVAQTDGNGRYRLQYTTNQWGAERGSHQVVITTRVEPVVGENGVTSVPGRPEMLPRRYHQMSELTAEVKPGRNTIDFELSSAGK